MFSDAGNRETEAELCHSLTSGRHFAYLKVIMGTAGAPTTSQCQLERTERLVRAALSSRPVSCQLIQAEWGKSRTQLWARAESGSRCSIYTYFV